ncbi:tRNA 4-thiouridine(8) synthase ThiI, partial [Patescibacteria group bacterium]|nr:tRNA 4-thiouridine(8) synthase ThiI [Patescibacteria group bacterium]
YVLEKLKVKSEKLKVKLKNPDINCFIEIVEGKALIYFEKIKGLGGLPVGTSGKVLSLISSGFDSPVAAWRLMKRGARVDFIHFHSYPRTSKASINNVKNLIKILNKYQFNSILYLAPLLDIQREIFAKCEERLRIILYRRFMFRIAEILAWKIGAGALVTGESLGQVASQTLENIGVANNAVSIPIFRPFIGADKIEIIDEAKKIGTYEFSSQPYEDCCSLFTPRHPATKARLGQVEFEESKLDSEKLIKEAIEKTEKVEIKN